MTPFLEYIIEILYIRSNCHDLEGIENLPEVMRPPPSQKPQILLKLVETSEEIRMQLLELLKIIISCAEEQFKYQFVNSLVAILKAFAIDPSPDIQRQANLLISQFARENKELLFHFTEQLGRSTLLALVSRNSKVRMAGIEALNEVLNCGIWKYNSTIFEILVGFRDPNTVPIKAFYEYTTHLNYFALLIKDPKIAVRELFIRSIGDWVTRLPDRYDHHPRLIPYLLAGIFDDYPEIVETAIDVLEEAGILQEREKEEELRESKQLGFDSYWTLNGKLKDLPLPPPFSKRPRLGTRLLIRAQVRKMWKALFNELRDFSIENKVKASRLILAGVVYSEDYMTQFLVSH